MHDVIGEDEHQGCGVGNGSGDVELRSIQGAGLDVAGPAAGVDQPLGGRLHGLLIEDPGRGETPVQGRFGDRSPIGPGRRPRFRCRSELDEAVADGVGSEIAEGGAHRWSSCPRARLARRSCDGCGRPTAASPAASRRRTLGVVEPDHLLLVSVPAQGGDDERVQADPSATVSGLGLDLAGVALPDLEGTLADVDAGRFAVEIEGPPPQAGISLGGGRI